MSPGNVIILYEYGELMVNIGLRNFCGQTFTIVKAFSCHTREDGGNDSKNEIAEDQVEDRAGHAIAGLRLIHCGIKVMRFRQRNSHVKQHETGKMTAYLRRHHLLRSAVAATQRYS